MHEVNLGPSLSDAEIDSRLEMEPDSEVIEAALQLIRNESAQYELDSHDDRSAGKSEQATLKQGAAQGLKSIFFAIVSKRARGMADACEGTDPDDE